MNAHVAELRPDRNELDAALAGARAGIDRGTLQPIQLVGIAERLGTAGRVADAVVLYQHWLARRSSPLDHVVHFNLGVSLSVLGQLAPAETAYRAALAIDPSFAQAWFNLGSVLERLGRPEEALKIWQSILDQRLVDGAAQLPLKRMVLNSLGRLLEQLRELERAEAVLRTSLRLDPQQPKVIQHWVHLRQKQCKWPVYAALEGVSHADLVRATSPLALLAAGEDPGLQLAAAVRFARERVEVRVPALAPAGGYAHARLRVGFLSSDFCMHPVALLTVELFELLDRARFELHGFCWSREDGSETRARIRRAFEHFETIGALDDARAARLIREREIDVLIDLQGLTAGARPDILAQRPAPVQISYLGFPGPTSLPGVDYVIADRYVIPESERPFYSETPLYLPDVFQCSDRQRPVAPTPTRAECGLPEDALVFCCFNNNYKFTPEMLSSWVRILQRVPNGVLWLLGDNAWAQDNLLAEAQRFGLARERVIFAGRVSPPAYLARYRVADVFLDTYPFNGGTTANDALWMGLPVLTRSGRTFASRMAGSLLRGLGLPELIATSQADYEQRAVELATRPGLLPALKQRLACARESAVLFDMPRFVRAFEELLASAARGAATPP